MERAIILNEQNWTTWRFQISIVLKSRDTEENYQRKISLQIMRVIVVLSVITVVNMDISRTSVTLDSVIIAVKKDIFIMTVNCG
ncbi:unnamed protein product [Euphydryas editha]|uniref:Uncharacterized protein n=1 Tax=Euphydryas editha TaxID=104508 RepID=A0AAU9VEP6_EUPED|nr:unnamed protein product [Euphydryas editha]